VSKMELLKWCKTTT